MSAKRPKTRRITSKREQKMSLQGTSQLPITVKVAHKMDVRTQFGALCYRIKGGKIQILLITSRGTGRWIIPKGWPMTGQTPAEGAAQEAWEEAGVIGKTFDQSLGIYSYLKKIARRTSLPVVAMIFPVKVKSLANEYPEVGQRKRKWVSQKKAAKMVSEPELAHIIAHFDPRRLKH